RRSGCAGSRRRSPRGRTVTLLLRFRRAPTPIVDGPRKRMRMAETPAPNLAELYRAAQLHHREGRLADAERAYRDLLRQQPQNAEVMQFLALVLAVTNRPAEAVALLRQALTLRNDRADWHSNLGEL